MGKLYQGRYRIESARRPAWDYRNKAAYFITICTHNRDCHFGEITDGVMELSHVGVIADILWHDIKNHSNYIEIDEYIVMPNHIHGILIISGNDSDNCLSNECNSIDPAPVETLHATSLPQSPDIPQSPIQPQSQDIPQPPIHPPSPDLPQPPIQPPNHNQFMSNISPKTGSISTIIRSYKSAVTMHSRRLGFEFSWQSRFHDHIIRNKESLERIRNYIRKNPDKWNVDKFYKTRNTKDS